MRSHLAVVAVSAAILVLAVEQSLGQQEKETNYENPVQTAAEDEIKNLPGLNDAINFRQYSGYLNANDKQTKFLHYWFVESQNDPAKDPVVLWLNGGPGCSSLGGLFTELGPFEVGSDGKSLKLREFSWNKVANVIFLESPSQVGFSYSKNWMEFHTDDSTANENHLALRSFFKKFPQYKNNPLYLTGESYAGVYLPTLGVLADADQELNLKGIAIGNGYLDVARLSKSAVFFGYHHGLIGKSLWDRFSKDCCDGKPPTRESCTLSDSRIRFKCMRDVQEITEILFGDGLNPYNLYADCADSGANRMLTGTTNTSLSSQQHRLSREEVDKQLFRIAMDSQTYLNKKPFHVLRTGDRNPERLGVSPPCTDEHLLVRYLNQPTVRNALHVPKKIASWDICSIISYVIKYPELKDGLAPQMKALINSPRKLSLLVYNGDVDMICNFLGDEWFVDDLGRKVIADYQAWKVDKQIAGYVKHYDGITFATIRGSGHMVPGDRPKEAFEMIKVFMNLTRHSD